MDRPLGDSSYEWNHMICGLWCRPSFTQRHAFKVHPCCTMNWHITTVDGQIILHYVHVPQFLYPSVHWWTFGLFTPFDDYEWCCHDRLCPSVYVNVYFLFLMDSFSGNGITGAHGNSVELFEELADWFPRGLLHFTAPPAILVDVKQYMIVVWFTFLWWLIALSVFSCAYWPSGDLGNTVESSVPILCPWFHWVLLVVFTYSGYETLIGYVICRCFLLVCRLSFRFLDGSLGCPKSFNFGEAHLSVFLLLPVILA